MDFSTELTSWMHQCM